MVDLRTARQRSPEAPFAVLLDALAGEDVHEERREHLDVIVRLGREYVDADGPHAGLEGFLAFLTATLRDDAPTADDAVELLTFHRAKGLEFATVFVTGLERGLVPIVHADTPAQRAEERRLLYVALTRAGNALHLSRARRRTVGARSVNRAPSPWLPVLQASWVGAAPGAPADPTAGLRASRARLAGVAVGADRLGPDDQALFERLKEWRKRVALASAVPAYVVCSDATLREIATARPTSADALLAVHGIGPVKAERFGDDVLAIVGQG
jgi:DNA helicase-2/ATP-dependent DNA helicase PcrA